MKSKAISVTLFLLVAGFLNGAYVGKIYFHARPGEPHRIFRVPASFLEAYLFRSRAIGKFNSDTKEGEITDTDAGTQLGEIQAYFQSEIEKGSLKIRLVQDDPETGMEHRRYAQYCRGLEVFGGEIIEHLKRGQVTDINGEYYEIGELDTVPLITEEIATHSFKKDLGRFDLVESPEESSLIVYPVNDDEYHLAFRVVLSKGAGCSMTGIIDARTGKVLLKYSNIRSDDLTIGIGNGVHGERYKFPTTYWDYKYWLMDLSLVRPVNQYTYDYRTSDGTYYYVASDNDNTWDSDGALVTAHVFLGQTYDYFLAAHGRKGIDDHNLNLKATVHWPCGQDCSFWDPAKNHIYFCDPGPYQVQKTAGLDVAAHEYSHGVTTFTSKLYSYCDATAQPGALDESFSDIMGTAVEFYWQGRGSGFNYADWVCGEDCYTYFGDYARSLVDPNSRRGIYDLPYPCHLSQCYVFYPVNADNDYGGVHFNSTLYGHAYFLLSEGGTNAISHKSVSGIGIDKATKIFFRAWTYWMTPNASFCNAANYLLCSASDLYGSSSNEYTQTVKSMEAIGWVVK